MVVYEFVVLCVDVFMEHDKINDECAYDVLYSHCDGTGNYWRFFTDMQMYQSLPLTGEF